MRPELADGVSSLARRESERCSILLSGSVDATINVWRVSTGERLHTLKGHTRGILDLAVDPMSYYTEEDTVYVLSASSTPEIRSWQVSYESATEVTSTLASEDQASYDATPKVRAAPDSAPISVHETSVNKLLFSPSDNPFDYDLYTASSDNSAKLLTRPMADTNLSIEAQERPLKWESTDTFTHPDWVRCIAHDTESGMLVTGCRDEDVRVWDTSSGECVRTLAGHFDSVEGVCIVYGQCGGPEKRDKSGNEEADAAEKWIISISLDGTLRRWRLNGSGEEEGPNEVEESQEGGKANEDDTTSSKKQAMTATEEEDKELAELMADMEDD